MSGPVARRRGIAVVLSCLLAAGAGPAVADTAPVTPTDPRTPVTVAADALPTVQVNGVVWQQLVVGDTVYAAGRFSSARPAGAAAGVGEVPRSNLLAYDLATGVLKPNFVANLNAQAHTLSRSPDGSRIYVGGDFTTVNGVSRDRVAALDPATGAVVPGFAPRANSEVKTIVATASTVYIGGAFSTINGTARSRLAAVASSSGALLARFAPVIPNGGVQALALAPEPYTPRLVVGGSFTTLNGSANPGYGLGAVDPSSGASLPMNANATVRDAGDTSAIMALTSDATTLYGTGYVYGPGGNLEGAFAVNWSDTNLKWLEDCHGDSYDVAASDTAVYVAGHPHFCGNVGGFPETTPRSHYRAVAFSRAATGTVKANTTGSYASFGGKPAPSLLNWFPEFNIGSVTGANQGPWAVNVAGPYVVYGGEFTRVNGVPQQGLVRFATKEIAPNKQGPRATGTDFQPTLRSPTPGTVTVEWPANWDRDNSHLTYVVHQDDVAMGTVNGTSTFWSRPRMSLTLTGVPAGSHRYKVVARDPFGNTVTSPVVQPSVPTTTTKTPAPGATNVAVGTTTRRTPFRVTFSEPVTGVTSSSFRIRRGTTAVAAAVTYDAASRTATLTPAAPLAADRVHTLSLTAAIRSVSGGTLAAQEWNIVTGPAPTVTSRTPASGATTASRTADVRATFSEPVTGIPVTATRTNTFTIKNASTGTVQAASARYDATTRVARLNPSATLAARTRYTVTLTSGIKDRAGNPLPTRSWSFTTGS